METDNKQDLESIKKELSSLKSYIMKNDFSDLYVYDTPVRFRRPNIYPKLDTPIMGSRGRIESSLDDGTTVYLAYYNGTETLATQQYTTTISFNNTTNNSVSSTYTVTSTFTPTSVIFIGQGIDNRNSYFSIINGWGGKNSATTTGCSNSVQVGASTNTGYSSTRLADRNGDGCYMTVSAWNSDGITLSYTLTPGFNNENSIKGNIILLG